MKVIATTRSEETCKECDYRQSLKISVDGVDRFRAHDGEPEDATLSRDFSDCHGIIGMMQDAYDAGKRGEEFIVEDVEE